MKLLILVITVAVVWQPSVAAANENYRQTNAYGYVSSKLHFLYHCRWYLGRQTLLDEERKAPAELELGGRFTHAEALGYARGAIRMEHFAEIYDEPPTATYCAKRWSIYQQHEADWYIGMETYIE